MSLAPYSTQVTVASLRDFPGKYEVECKTASLDTPFQPISTCVRLKQIVSLSRMPLKRTDEIFPGLQLPRCQRPQRKHCLEEHDPINCEGAFQFCRAQLGKPFVASGKWYAINTSQYPLNSLLNRHKCVRHHQGSYYFSLRPCVHPDEAIPALPP
jgi:hypothetical protein